MTVYLVKLERRTTFVEHAEVTVEADSPEEARRIATYKPELREGLVWHPSPIGEGEVSGNSVDPVLEGNEKLET